MSRYSGKIAQSVSGVQIPVPGAKVYVYSSATGEALETLTDDVGAPLDNPLVTDEYGDFYFNSADGTKKLDVFFRGERKWREVVSVGVVPGLIGGGPFSPLPGSERRIQAETFGRGDTASAFTVIANSVSPADGTTFDRQAQINGGGGIEPDSSIGKYADRDSVAFYADNQAVPLMASVSGTFTVDRFIPTSPLSASLMAKLEKGMIIDTDHTPRKFSGIIDSWKADGSSVEVTGWYEVYNGSSATPPEGQIPPGTATALINPITKIWAMNANVFLFGHEGFTSHGDKATGFELGGYNTKGAPNRATLANSISLYDAVNLGNTGVVYDEGLSSEYQFYAMAYAFEQRGHFLVGFSSQNCEEYAFLVKNGTSRNPLGSFRTEAAGGIPFQAAPGGRPIFAARNDGVIDLGFGDGGAPSPAAELRLHSSGAAHDFDSRIRGVGGGAGTLGGGDLFVDAYKFSVNSTILSFFNRTGAPSQAVGAAATDAASNLALTNFIRTALINYGLVTA